MTTWEPNTYLSFEEERTRPARDLLSGIPLSEARSIFDLGCGPGNSTALLRSRWPDAKITGVDSSPEMIKRAKKSDETISWELSNVEGFKPDQKADLIFSNAALHWLDNHEELFPHLLGMLCPGGVLAVQMPRNFTSPSHTIIQQVVEGGSWANTLRDVRSFNPVARAEDYYTILSPMAAKIDIWETEYTHILSQEDAVLNWIMGTALRPYLDALTPDEAKLLLEECRGRLAQAYQARPNGTTLFPFKRLFIIATMPQSK